MATKVNFYENYGKKSARERAELIYSNYCEPQYFVALLSGALDF